MKYIIKKYRITQYIQLSRLFKEFDMYNKQFDKKKHIYTEKEYMDWAKKMSRMKPLMIYLAFEPKNKQAIGYMSGYFLKHNESFFIEDLFVTEHSRSLGLGGQFIKAIQEQFGEKLKEINLEIYNWNRKGLSFYQKQGFKENTDIKSFSLAITHRKPTS